MLTKDEVSEAMRHVVERKDWFDENITPGEGAGLGARINSQEEKFSLLAAEMGMTGDTMETLIESILEANLGVPWSLAAVLSPGTARAVFYATLFGIEIGKRVERASKI